MKPSLAEILTDLEDVMERVDGLHKPVESEEVRDGIEQGYQGIREACSILEDLDAMI